MAWASRRVIITGAWTNMSIEHTARHSADAGYQVVVASDGTSTVNDEWQNVALNYALTNVGDVATCEEIGDALEHGRGRVDAAGCTSGRREALRPGRLARCRSSPAASSSRKVPSGIKAEECLYFSDMPGDVRRRWSDRDGVTEVMRPANKCNGMTYDAERQPDRLRAHHEHAWSWRRGAVNVKVLASHYEGKEINSPNDVVVGNDGSIYFSDPPFGRVPVFGVERDRELDFQGVFRIPPGGGELKLEVEDFETPNGLCFTPDGSQLYINDSTQALIRLFDVAADGSFKNGQGLLRPHRQLATSRRGSPTG